MNQLKALTLLLARLSERSGEDRPPCATSAIDPTGDHLDWAAAAEFIELHCDHCPVRPECHVLGLSDPEADGIYGGEYVRHGNVVPLHYLNRRYRSA